MQEGVLISPQKHSLVQIYNFDGLPLIAMNVARIGAQIPSLTSELGGSYREGQHKKNSKEKAINTVIGRESESEGRFVIQNGVRVDGVLKGELISSGTLIVGETGVIEADVRVRDALVSGRMVGTLIAEEKVHLQSQAVFVGKIMTKGLIVEEGATFKAECEAGGDIRLSEASKKDLSSAFSEESAFSEKYVEN